jgi:hypothetical protein
MIEKYNKITPGFVTQRFERRDKKFICIEQSFTAGDPVDRENEQGEPVDVDVRDEQYQPFNMVQPGFDYYVVGMMGCVEPELHGPFATDDEQQGCIDRLREEEGEDENTFFVMNVTKGATVEF